MNAHGHVKALQGMLPAGWTMTIGERGFVQVDDCTGKYRLGGAVQASVDAERLEQVLADGRATWGKTRTADD